MLPRKRAYTEVSQAVALTLFAAYEKETDQGQELSGVL
jgi:hypothetical protein